MCGRFANSETIPRIAAAWSAEVAGGEAWVASEEIRPTDQIAVLLEGGGRPRRVGTMRWGWPREFADSGQITVARSDAIRVKPTYRDVWAGRRCLLPATAWFEWQGTPASAPKKTRKTKHRLHPAVAGPWAMAGLWEPYPAGGARAGAALLITVDAHASIAAVHERMPAIVSLAAASAWLRGSSDEAFGLLVPAAGFAEPVA